MSIMSYLLILANLYFTKRCYASNWPLKSMFINCSPHNDSFMINETVCVPLCVILYYIFRVIKTIMIFLLCFRFTLVNLER